MQLQERRIKEIVEHRGVRLAEEHAEWFIEVIRKVYIDAFVHGYKHGVSDAMRMEEYR